MEQVDVASLQDFVTRLSGGDRQALLLDVREPWEVALGRIELPGAQAAAIPMNSIPTRLDELDPSQVIVCICHHGMRSAQVGAYLERQGYQAVWNLRGGTDAWSAQVDPRLPRY